LPLTGFRFINPGERRFAEGIHDASRMCIVLDRQALA
jgi:hypothetical protein